MNSEGAREGSIIVDSNGKRIVRNGIEYHLSDEEYEKINPAHRNSGCIQCSFIENKNDLLVWYVPRELKNSAGYEPVYCGRFCMPGWTGHSGFYLFKCKSCGNMAIDYPHGYRGENMYLRCDGCRFEIILLPKKYREIYIREGFYVPKKPTLKEKRQMVRSAKKRLSELEEICAMGVIPIVSQSRPKENLKRRLIRLFRFKT